MPEDPPTAAAPPPAWVLRHRWEVGARLRAFRQAHGLTQEQLAERAGMDNKTVSRIENGRYATDIDQVARLAAALGVPSWSFFKD